ncbi:MAG: hypothetical protein R6X09_11465, partial [Bacteroidales bacterium]
ALISRMRGTMLRRLFAILAIVSLLLSVRRQFRRLATKTVIGPNAGVSLYRMMSTAASASAISNSVLPATSRNRALPRTTASPSFSTVFDRTPT